MAFRVWDVGGHMGFWCFLFHYLNYWSFGVWDFRCWISSRREMETVDPKHEHNNLNHLTICTILKKLCYSTDKTKPDCPQVCQLGIRLAELEAVWSMDLGLNARGVRKSLGRLYIESVFVHFVYNCNQQISDTCSSH